DPITKKDSYIAPDGYDAIKDDDAHQCSDAQPNVGTIVPTKVSGSTYQINVSVVAGNHPLQQLDIKVGSVIVASLPISSPGTYSANYTFTTAGSQTITATVTDSVFYTNTGTQAFTPDVATGSQPGPGN
ncbi:MAG TPA: hypothetical protein VIQ80_02995, partial [Candidatus Saccharimonadales bacterium]